MSIHTAKAQAKARALGGYAGREEASDLWDFSKRELVEIALRLGEMCRADNAEPGFEGALARVHEERKTLLENGII